MTESARFLKIVKNVLLCEPLTYEGRKALRTLNISMTEDDFFNRDVYVEPFSEHSKPLDKSKLQDPDISYYEETDLQQLLNTKEIFEDKLKHLTDGLFVVKGVAGSGKTTYLHKLKQNYHHSINFHICNFEDAKQSFDFMNQSYDFDDLFSNNIYKFISILLTEISRILRRFNKNSESEHRKFIGDLVTQYFKYFVVSEDQIANSPLEETNMDTKKQRQLFENLYKYSQYKISYSELASILLNILTQDFENNNMNARKKLAFVAGFIIRLYFCISKLENKKQICVIDNIEVFVKYQEENPIQVCELEEIIYGCNEAAKSIRSYLAPIQNNSDYKTFYGFLIITRDTTASTALVNMRHYDDYKNENEVNISKWFCIEDIYIKKMRYFLSNGGAFNDNCYATAYENILKDFSIYRWGLNDIVSKMYKHSHRRNIECVTEAIASVPEEEIRYFNEMWNIAIIDDEKSFVKTMCRKYVLRLLIDYVQKTQYFDKLLVKNPSIENGRRTIESYNNKAYLKERYQESNSLARKISTVLHCFQLQEGPEKYMSFQQLVYIIFKKPYLPGSVQPKNIVDMAKILYIMNETRNNETNWTSLVCIKFSNKETYNLQTLSDKINKQWNKYEKGEITINDTSEYGICITEAGSFFAKIVADFEYFGCRFLSNEPALLSLKNFRSIQIDNARCFRAVKIIEIIRKNAFKCIDETIENDYEFFSYAKSETKKKFSQIRINEYDWLYKELKNDKASTHAFRILTHHIGYLNNYLKYIDSIPKEKFEKNEDKTEIYNLVYDEMQKYERKMNKLIKIEKKEYFE